jgi:serine/threonine protein kinase
MLFRAFVITIVASAQRCGAEDPNQRAALLDLVKATSEDPLGFPWTSLYNGFSKYATSSYCDWNDGDGYGCFCDAGENVERLVLPKNNLYGTLPASMIRLTALRELDLHLNHLDQAVMAGPSSPSMAVACTLASLERLDIGASFSPLGRSIPHEIGALTSLTFLSLRANEMVGILPDALAKLPLQRLLLDANKFTGMDDLVCGIMEKLSRGQEPMADASVCHNSNRTDLLCCELNNNAFGDDPSLCPTCANSLCFVPLETCKRVPNATAGPTAGPTLAPTKAPTKAPTSALLPGLSPALRHAAAVSAIVVGLFLLAAAIVTLGVLTFIFKRMSSEKRAELVERIGWSTTSSAPLLADGRERLASFVSHTGGVVAIPIDIMVAPHLVAVGKKLAAGGMGAVRMGEMGGEQVVLKSIFSQMLSGDELEFWKEAQMLWSLRHPHVVRIFGVVRNPSCGGRRRASTISAGGNGEEEEEDELFMVMEWCSGGALSELVRDGAYRADQWLPHACQLARTLEFLHSRGVIHRDIKPSNVLLDAQGEVKVCDLGVARLQQLPGSLSVSPDMTLGIGTPSWMPPEAMVVDDSVLMQQGEGGSEENSTSSGGTGKSHRSIPSFHGATIDGRAWDIFSLSMVFVYMYKRASLWPNLNSLQIASAVSRGHRPHIPSDAPPALRLLIESMWDAIPANRPSALRVCEVLESEDFASQLPYEYRK